MLNNIETIDNLRGLARAKSRNYESRTVSKALRPELEAEGWQLEKENQTTVRMFRTKKHSRYFEDRVWTLLYRIGFDYLSAEQGATLLLDPKDLKSPKNQLDVVAIDEDAAIAVECKSAEAWTRKQSFDKDIAKFAEFRSRFSAAVRSGYQGSKTTVFAIWTRNIDVSANELARAKQMNVVVLDERDLEYYENLLEHIGPAAKYQLMADLLEGKTVSGLKVRIPAVKVKMGKETCYSFSITPQYLLKISYVSHRAKGGASSVDAYQRMLKRSRLNRIREFIEDDGIFPTNIVINLPKKGLSFEKVKQEGDGEAGVLGWLDIRPMYKSAWIIDGQHRLFAYSGLPQANTASLSILAFEDLQPSKQAELFIDINAKQKSVKRSLLETLYAELHWDSEDPHDRINAIISKSVQALGEDRNSPFFERIQDADEAKDALRCISLTSVFTALERTKFFIAKEKHGEIFHYGPLWVPQSNDKTLKRTVAVVNTWFKAVDIHAKDWWAKGSGEGGGLAMNDGVVSLIVVLRSVLTHLQETGKNLESLDDEDLCELIQPYADALGQYLGGLGEPERRFFRELRGGQGQMKRTKMCEKAIRDRFQAFQPPGLDEYLEAERQQTNLRSRDVIDEIEKLLQTTIIDELKREFSGTPDEWWTYGVPKEIRKQVTALQEEDDNKRERKEAYFNLIHYKKIAEKHWDIFEPLIAIGAGNKEKRLSWLEFVNDKRNVAHHASAGVTISVEDFDRLSHYAEELKKQVGVPRAGAATAGDSAE